MDDILRLDLNSQLGYSLTLHSMECDETIPGLAYLCLRWVCQKARVKHQEAAEQCLVPSSVCLPSRRGSRGEEETSISWAGQDRRRCFFCCVSVVVLA